MVHDQIRVLEHAIDAGWADGDDIGIEHHEGKPAVAFERVFGVVVDDRSFLPILEPPVTRDQRVVLVGQAVALPPIVKLAGGDTEPGDEPLDGDLGMLRPVGDVVDDGVADVMGNPGLGQSSPSSFFN
jgi:hypothetical protein